MKDIENKVLIGITSLALLLCLVKKRFQHIIVLISSCVWLGFVLVLLEFLKFSNTELSVLK
jgi:hypothetical protein